MIEAYLSALFSGNEPAVVSKVCRKLLDKIVRPSLAAPTSTAVALGRPNLLWDLLPDHIEEHVLDFEGLPILAKGFLFHNEDGSASETPREMWQFGSDLGELPP